MSVAGTIAKMLERMDSSSNESAMADGSPDEYDDDAPVGRDECKHGTAGTRGET